MHRTLKIYQLNVRKQRLVEQSVMNDGELQDFAVLALSEPYSFREGNQVRTVPLGHSGWTKLLPTCQREGRWAIRSMLWIQNVVESERVVMEAEQVAVQCTDITEAPLLVTPCGFEICGSF